MASPSPPGQIAGWSDHYRAPLLPFTTLCVTRTVPSLSKYPHRVRDFDTYLDFRQSRVRPSHQYFTGWISINYHTNYRNCDYYESLCTWQLGLHKPSRRYILL